MIHVLCVALMTHSPAVCWTTPSLNTCSDEAFEWFDKARAWSQRSHITPDLWTTCTALNDFVSAHTLGDLYNLHGSTHYLWLSGDPDSLHPEKDKRSLPALKSRVRP